MYVYRVRRDADSPWSRWATLEKYQWDALRESSTTQKRIQ